MRNVNLIVIHCSATQEGKNFQVEDIRQMHLARGFSDIGYHYVITLDGRIHLGRDRDKIGAHAHGYNRNSIGICYIGGLDKNNMPKDTRTEAQKEALRCLVNDMKEQYPGCKVVGHRDLSPDLNGDGIISKWEWKKVCPCYSAIDEYK